MSKETLNIETVEAPADARAKLKATSRNATLCRMAASVATVAAIGKLGDLSTGTIAVTAGTLATLEAVGGVYGNFMLDSIPDDVAEVIAEKHSAAATYVIEPVRAATFAALISGCLVGYKMYKED